MKKITLLAALFATVAVQAQDADTGAAESTETKAPVEFSGSVDTYYRTAITSKDKGGAAAPSSSFAGGTGFNLGMINLVVSQDGEKTGFVADLAFGPRGNSAIFNSGAGEGSAEIINQLYAYWKATEDLTFTLGNFNTFLGYEVISPTANFNYSTSYLFSYGPFSHTGLKLDYSISDELSVAVALMNPTDFTADPNGLDNMTLGLQIGYTADNGSAFLNYVGGNQGTDGGDPTHQIDLTTGWDLSDELYVGFNASTQIQTVDGGDAQSFLGAALYAQYALSDDFSLGFRGEYFGVVEGYLVDAGGDGAFLQADGDGANNVIGLTVSGNYSVGNLTFIPEIRMDVTGEDQFTDTEGDATNSLASFTLAAVYAF